MTPTQIAVATRVMWICTLIAGIGLAILVVFIVALAVHAFWREKPSESDRIAEILAVYYPFPADTILMLYLACYSWDTVKNALVWAARSGSSDPAAYLKSPDYVDQGSVVIGIAGETLKNGDVVMFGADGVFKKWVPGHSVEHAQDMTKGAECLQK